MSRFLANKSLYLETVRDRGIVMTVGKSYLLYRTTWFLMTLGDL